ncbi:MAG: GrpB family protein, partial [Dehalococcoidia bacterium]|nr:GrpB family protein [Dehalococcoidia bacterium]
MTYPVGIVNYDPQWPVLYEEEKGRILDVIGRRIAAIEHIGSTAVPELAAKPIIDIMIAVRRLADADECIEPLQDIGYEYVREFEVEMPERRFFR